MSMFIVTCSDKKCTGDDKRGQVRVTCAWRFLCLEFKHLCIDAFKQSNMITLGLYFYNDGKCQQHSFQISNLPLAAAQLLSCQLSNEQAWLIEKEGSLHVVKLLQYKSFLFLSNKNAEPFEQMQFVAFGNANPH